MEERNVPPLAPIYGFQNPPSPKIVHFCSTCDKPFISESSRDRHRNYCGRRRRNRPRSCRSCTSAKTKCSFESPCSRCTKKAIHCVYDESTAVERQVFSNTSIAARDTGRRPSTRLDASTADDWLVTGDENMFNHTFADDSAMDNGLTPMFSSHESPSLNLSPQKSSPIESSVLDGFLPFDNYSLGQPQYLADSSVIAIDKPDQKIGHWCEWMQRGVSLSVVTEAPEANPDSNLLAILQIERPHAEHDANIVIQSLRSFPTMMLRRETFPWFIHPLSHLLPTPASDTLPEALSTCMSIAQMFASRTSETKHLLRRSIRNEYRRFIDKMCRMSQFELVAALQACMIYLIMFMVDQSIDAEEAGTELVHALRDLCEFSRQTCELSASQSKPSNLNASWKDWIFAESQRRLMNLWFLVGCVVCVKTGLICDPSQSYRDIPLPSPKALWEAPSQAAWELEYEACHNFQTSGLINLGNLIDLQQSEYSPSIARKLDQWNAGVDNLGTLLNLVGSMV